MPRYAIATGPDECPISYQIFGAPNPGRRVVLVHSLAMTEGFWAATVRALGLGVEILTLDCRGHGRSGKPPGPYQVEGFAADVTAVMDHAGWRDAVVAGASMGGSVALATAILQPSRVQALGLIDTTAWYGPTAAADWNGRAEKALAEGLASLTSFQQTRWFSDVFRAANPETVAEAVAVFLANDLQAYAETCRMLGRVDLRAGLAGLTVPVAILVGEEDYATPVAMAQAMAEAIPRARLTVLPGIRHLTPLEVPDTIAAHLRTLLEPPGVW